jgi:lysophospholipase L1-like esterase
MKKLFFVSVFILSFLVLSGQIFQQEIKGHSASVAFDELGYINILYEIPGQGLGLCKIDNQAYSCILNRTLLKEGTIHNPRLKRDAEGRLWASWQEGESDEIHIHLALVEKEKLVREIKISQDFPGRNILSSFDIDSNNNIWIAWINQAEKDRSLIVFEGGQERTWVIAVQEHFSIYSPKILCDDHGQVWVFWAQCQSNSYEIKVRRFNDRIWGDAECINPDTAFPVLSLDAHLDPYGRPWVVWSAYDGIDYEIYLTNWDSFYWKPQLEITQNESLSDVSPRLAFDEKTPLIIWNQIGLESRVCLKFSSGNIWSKTGYLKDFSGFNRNPQIAVFNDSYTVIWQNVTLQGTEIKFENIGRDRLVNFRHRVSSRETPRINIPFHGNMNHIQVLIKDRYSAVGDSITYGVLARRWFPEKGYVPRLETLLKTYLDSPRILNRGIPGEQTWEGLARLEHIIQADQSKYLLLMEGTNDMFAGIPESIAAFNIEEMVKKAIQHRAYPLVATIIPRSDDNWDSNIQKATRQYNELVRKIPPAYYIPLVDQNKTFVSHPNGYLALFSDGAHPNELGYQVMAEAWLEGIKKLPRPPIGVEVQHQVNQILFYDEHINVITWKENPDFSGEISYKKYHIFRKQANSGENAFVLIQTVDSNTFNYIDRDILSSQTFVYHIQAENTDGVRGPVSQSVYDR